MLLEKPLVLCVDDDAAIQSALARILGKTCRIIKAMDATEALDAFNAHRKDLLAITMDGKIPGVQDTTELVRTMRETYAGPIIACSSDINDLLMEAGCTCALPKPFSPNALIELIEKFKADATL